MTPGRTTLFAFVARAERATAPPAAPPTFGLGLGTWPGRALLGSPAHGLDGSMLHASAGELNGGEASAARLERRPRISDRAL